MKSTSLTSLGWSIRIHSGGEVLAVRAGIPGLELVLLGRLEGFTTQEAEGWLRELLGVSLAPEGSGPATHPSLPPLLHRALSGLLFYQSELWGRSEGLAPCTMALVHEAGVVGFGWVGPGAPSVRIPDLPTVPEPIVIHDDDGGEGHVLLLEPDHEAEIVMRWTEADESAEATLLWSPVADASTDPAAPDGHTATSPMSHLVASAEAAEGPPGDAMIAFEEDPGPPSVTRGRPADQGHLWRFRSWVDRLRGIRREPPEPAVEEAWSPAPESAEAEQLIPPTPEPESLAQASAPLETVEEAWLPAADDPADTGFAHTEPEVDETGTAADPEVFEEASCADIEVVDEAIIERAPDEDAFQHDGGITDERLPAETMVPAPIERDGETSAIDAPSAAGDWEAADSEEPSDAAVRFATEPEPSEAPNVEPTVASRAPMPEPPAVIMRRQTFAHDDDPFALALPEDRHVPPPPLPRVETRRWVNPYGDDEIITEVEPESASNVLPREVQVDTPRALELVPPPVAAVRETPAFMRAPAQRTAWPEPEEAAAPRWRRLWPWGLLVLVLFGAGWLFGAVDNGPGSEHRSLGQRLTTALGFGPPQFKVDVSSSPDGAWIAVDGRDLARRTPATLDLPVGPHQVVLAFPDLGSVALNVRAARGEHRQLNGVMWGALAVTAGDAGVPVHVAVDGQERGVAPLTIDNVLPGIHQLTFSAAGLAPWTRTLEVRVNQTVEVAAQPVSSPAKGLLEVRATLAGDEGSQTLPGASVWIDGALRGVTPLRLELPRGPHSVRVAWHDDQPPIQVIDLPGGNQRFATFELGASTPHPRIVLDKAATGVPLDRASVISATLEGVRPADVREMWLHARTPEGAWRRYPMSVLPAPGGVVGVSVFPVALFDSHGQAPWYVSAALGSGDEYFTEILTATSR